MSTRKFPRSIKEAFGPHSCDNVEPCDPPMTWHDKLIIFVCLICYVAAIWRIATEVF